MQTLEKILHSIRCLAALSYKVLSIQIMANLEKKDKSDYLCWSLGHKLCHTMPFSGGAQM